MIKDRNGRDGYLSEDRPCPQFVARNHGRKCTRFLTENRVWALEDGGIDETEVANGREMRIMEVCPGAVEVPDGLTASVGFEGIGYDDGT
ncbi:MAG: hypothetical protein JWN86_1040 [Planctomycetota bacterium]|nr:hypothetical protein [Planctomycetota bacterium]